MEYEVKIMSKVNDVEEAKGIFFSNLYKCFKLLVFYLGFKF